MINFIDYWANFTHRPVWHVDMGSMHVFVIMSMASFRWWYSVLFLQHRRWEICCFNVLFRSTLATFLEWRKQTKLSSCQNAYTMNLLSRDRLLLIHRYSLAWAYAKVPFQHLGLSRDQHLCVPYHQEIRCCRTSKANKNNTSHVVFTNLHFPMKW